MELAGDLEAQRRLRFDEIHGLFVGNDRVVHAARVAMIQLFGFKYQRRNLGGTQVCAVKGRERSHDGCGYGGATAEPARDGNG